MNNMRNKTEDMLVTMRLALMMGEIKKLLKVYAHRKSLDGLYVEINVKTRELITLYLN